MDTEFADILEIEKLVKGSIGFNLIGFIKEWRDVDDLSYDNVLRHIEMLKKHKMRFKNQLMRNYNEKYFFFHNSPTIQKYINKIREYIEPSDRRCYIKYIYLKINELCDDLTLIQEGRKKEAIEKNKAHIKEHASEPIKCDCGAVVSRAIISRHKKTKKHLHNMLLLEVV